MWSRSAFQLSTGYGTYCSEGSGIQKETADSKYSYSTATVVNETNYQKGIRKICPYFMHFL